MSAREYPNKRQRTDPTTSKTKRFSNAAEVRSALRSDNHEDLVDALTTLRNQLSVKIQDEIVSPQDYRLDLVKQWMQSAPGASDLFTVWDTAAQRQPVFSALVLSILTSILTLLSTHYTDHALGQPVMKALLVPSRLRQLNSFIGGSHNDSIIMTLKLYNAMCNFAGGHDRKAVLEGFGWEIKSLPKLFNMRRKTHGQNDTADPFLRPDIRTLYILFLLSFLDVGSTSQIKTAFLEQHREPFFTMFKGLAHDHYSLARKILEVCWTGLWSDSKVKRTLKVGIFNETTLSHLFKLYDRIQPENDDGEHIPANLVHHFLLAICTRPGVGICFKDRGWYPREVDKEEWGLPNSEDDTTKKSGKVYNKILTNILKTLKVNEDSRQQELAIKIIAACPELVSGYWSAAALTLEPRLSSKWIANIAVFGNIISLPVPTAMFYMPNTQLYQPSPPPLSTIIENILPSVGTKNNFSKGLQSTSGMVQHCTALALSKCLVKYHAVLGELRKIALALEENEEDGQWNKRCVELEKEARRRVPDFQVIIGFSQQKHIDGQVNQTRVALLAEAAQRLLWLYHRCLPAVVAEARFDLGKLLQTFAQETHSGDQTGDVENGKLPDTASRLYRIQQLHILSLLKDSDQFVGTAKIASLPHTPFHILLTALTQNQVPAIRVAIVALLHSILSQSTIFQEDIQEPDLWLRALPDRSLETSDADDVSHRSSEGLVIFLDDCVQRCLKTPYRYVETLHALVADQMQTAEDRTERLDMFPSPLIMTVLEQLDAKINNKSLYPSHLLAIITYIRNLILGLSSKTLDLHFLQAYACSLEGLVVEKRLLHYEPTMRWIIRREINIILAILSFSFEVAMPLDSMPEVDAFMAEVEHTELVENQRLRSLTAVRLIAQLRTLKQALASADLKRLIKTVATLDYSAVSSVVENLIPGQNDVWNALDLILRSSDYQSCLRFDWLYIHSGLQDITREGCQVVLIESLFSRKPTLINLSRALCLIVHGISSARQKDDVLKAHFNLLAKLFESTKASLPTDNLKDIFFKQSSVIKNILMSPAAPTVLEGLKSILKAALDSSSIDDRKTVATISSHWFDVLKSDLGNQASASISTACIWIKYMEYGQLFDLIDFFEEANAYGPATLETISAILKALSAITSEWQAEILLVQKLPQLLSLTKVLPGSALLEQIIAVAVEATLPIGLDGYVSSLTSLQSFDLVAAVQRAESRWGTCRHGMRGQVNIQSFLSQSEFSDSTAKIISSLVFQQSSARKRASEWLQSEQPFLHEARHLIPILHAFFESVIQDETFTLPPGKTWLPFITKIIQTIANVDVPADIRMRAKACLLAILSVSGDDRPTLLNAMAKDMKHASRILSHELISTAVEIGRRIGAEAESTVSVILDHGLQWCVEQFASDYEVGYDIIIEDLTRLVKVVSSIKSHLVETLMQVVIQNCISNVNALRLVTACLKVAQLKPLTVNRHLQTILQHVQFFKFCSLSLSESNAIIRDAIIELLHCLFHLHPHNTCQITHVDPLIRIYGGHLSKTDLRILSIFHLFESQRKLSVTPLISRWSSAPNALSDTALEALQSLDPVIVLRTCLNFPHWRRLEDKLSNLPKTAEEGLYDPVFLMLLFSHMLAEQTPTTAFGWINLFRTNVVSLFIRALSAKDGEIRDLALSQVVGLWKHIMTADLQEKPHVIYLLYLLKDLMPVPTHSIEHSPQLPTYTTLLLMHSLRAIFNPSNLIYPITARFLLQRPTFDTADVPMLFGMLYSSSDDHWKKERGWMIKFLGDGMVGSNDWRVLKRRHTWDLLASLFQSSDGVDDIPLRMGILEILANLTCNVQATNSLILKSALLPWIEMQLQHPNSQSEGVEWTKILDNILIIVDAPKVEASTNGGWRTIICRCLMSLLNDKNPFAVANFAYAVPVILRLASLSGHALTDLPSLLEVAVRCVDQLESDEDLSVITPTEQLEAPFGPHRSLTLHHKLKISSYAQLFLMEQMLWRVSMLIGRKRSTWAKLTPRLILGRAIYGTEGSEEIVVDVAEWARKEVVSNIIQAR